MEGATVLMRSEIGLFCFASSFTFTFQPCGLREGVFTFPFVFAFAFAFASAFALCPWVGHLWGAGSRFRNQRARARKDLRGRGCLRKIRPGEVVRLVRSGPEGPCAGAGRPP